MTYIIAVDGPSGSGKSTISQIIAEKLKIEYLNTGLMYRAVTKYFLDKDLDEETDDKILKGILEEISIDFKDNKLLLNGIDVTDKLRNDEVTANVSWVSARSYVREKMVDLQRKIAENTSFILDGRDIGSVVFPDAKYKFYLTASALTRARRRFDQGESDMTVEEIEKAIIKRDNYDSNRKVSPLKIAEGAVVIDSSDLNINQTVDKILSYMEKNDVL
ncbi:(d)CMP kinase [Anaerococcus degeneri]|uniref:Cytidylate kinase n=1 Tax=Anaerococcus degeneri TaxID=361500 RepID=A0ABS7YWG1_9FIRM|nr:(d)CMP kinase [Anaerococcus degeneri]MBP2015109.1 cytidylate kinase [Anaerococcus degeneri]MCA2095369.1 (d)CMP kinase [Anaerococcus degeneri]